MPDPEDQPGAPEELGGPHPHACRAGCKIGSGSDLLGDMQAQRALEFEVKSQVMKPIEVLRSATMFNVEIFRLADRIGSVEPGKRADLLAIVKGAAFVKRAP